MGGWLLDMGGVVRLVMLEVKVGGWNWCYG